MGPTRKQIDAANQGDAYFATTNWSLVRSAGKSECVDARQALAELCQTYWYPIYAFVRRRGHAVDDAQDLTQEFFSRLLEKKFVTSADQEHGKFRAYLITACKRFLVNEWRKGQSQKRGGGKRTLSLDFDAGESKYALEAVDAATAERLYEQQWAITLLARVLDKLRTEYADKGKQAQFEHLKAFISGSKESNNYAVAAQKLSISQGAAKVAAHRLRKRYRVILRDEILQTVETPDEVDNEIRSLFEILGS